MTRKYKQRAHKDYPTRYCPHCSKPIPRVSKTGVYRRASRYALVKTCGDSDCWGREWVGTRLRNTTLDIELSPVDQFLCGKVA